MKKTIYTFSFLLFLFSVSICQTINADLKITIKRSYCGGARPTQEMLAELEKPMPFAKETIILVGKNSVDSAKTNVEGKVTFKVKSGNYSLYEAWRYYHKTPDGSSAKKFSKSCLKKEWTLPFMKIISDGKAVKSEELFPLIMKCPWNYPCIKPTEMPPMPQ